MIEAVIFDFDGVLVDTEPLYVERKKAYLESRGIHMAEQEIKKFAGKRFYQAIMEISADISEEMRKKLADEFKVPMDLDYRSLLFPDVKETLRALKKMGLKTAIASNSPQEKLEEAVRQCCLSSLLDEYISSSAIGRLKPEPDVYLQAASKLNILPRNCIAVEDADCGLAAAKRAGCHVVCKKDNRFGFSQTLGDYKIKHLSELADYIKKLNQK
ncbi:HAD family phosphatase [Lachnospiraceae bacterium 62-35]